jgi:hypothetical protein
MTGNIDLDAVSRDREFGENTLNLSASNIANPNIDVDRPSRPGPLFPKPLRCKHWPTCSYPNCNYRHPTKPCYAYPNCPNAPGTCSYLHMDQDLDERGVPKTRTQIEKDAAPQPQIDLCRYRDKCASKSCPFGHPTACNDNAKIIKLEWCADSTNCKNPECDKAHPSGCLIRAPAAIPTYVLESCKYGQNCTNPNCRYRHVLSPIMCRNGANCQRPDCFFTHPKAEQCKYGVNCKNLQCVYIHPEGRDEAAQKPLVWTKDQSTEREFAVHEDEVMEKVIPGQSQEDAMTH